jgi:hypothetical protein
MKPRHPIFTEDSATGCWEWQGSRSRSGYGRWRVGDKLQQAHRVLYEEFVGPIPDGLDLDHLCRNRACVNPGHMEPVTRQENCQRGLTGAHNARKTRCVNGHLFDEANTGTYRGQRVCRACKREEIRRRRAAA